jgi:hypothetical protein
MPPARPLTVSRHSEARSRATSRPATLQSAPKPGPIASEPPTPSLWAAAVCALAALSLLWPLLTGDILFGGERSDMYIAGYSFRLFGAETFRATGTIPQWNPYLFGGLPYIAAMHGDIFYPTAWLRWIMPVDLAITWGMAIHFVLAGWLTYVLGRSLRLSWSGALAAGVAYELSGIVASQMSPGHDGKLFVSALAPLSFWLLLRAIRDGRQWAYGAFAFVVALTVLAHYNMAYFLFIALGLWSLYLTFWDPERTSVQSRWRALGLAALSIIVGIGIASLQLLPFLEYIKHSPRADGGLDTGVAFATSYAMPPSELPSLVLPQFNGVLDHYWGSNPLKFHTEYVGALPFVLALLAWGDSRWRRLVAGLTIGAILFLLVAFGGQSPLYPVFAALLPYLNKTRALGMVFFLPAFFMSLLAGIGLDRVLSGRTSTRTVVAAGASLVALAVLGVSGALQPVAEAMAIPERAEVVLANADALRLGAARLLLFAALTVIVLWLASTRRVTARVATGGLLAIMIADLWSIDRQFYHFSPRADVLFRDDAITTRLKQAALPYRVLDAGDGYGQSILMAYGIPNVLGYHGFELRYFDELGGRADGWRNLLTPNLMELLSVRFLILREPQPLPGFHQIGRPTTTAVGKPAVLYERDSTPAYARVMLTAAKAPEGQIPPTLADPRFPVGNVVLYPDSSTIVADSIVQPFPRSSVRASVNKWAPGAMTISLVGADSRRRHLVVSENWYPDWHATVDGRTAQVRRADQSLIGLEIPAGAREVKLWFDSPTYARAKVVSCLAVLAALTMVLLGAVHDRRTTALAA